MTYAACNVQFAMPALGSGHLTWARVTRHKCHALGELAKPVAEFSSWARGCHCHEVQYLDTPDCKWPSVTSSSGSGPFSGPLLARMDIRSLAGNAMHAACVGAIVDYACSRAVPRARAQWGRFHRMGSALSEASDDDVAAS